MAVVAKAMVAAGSAREAAATATATRANRSSSCTATCRAPAAQSFPHHLTEDVLCRSQRPRHDEPVVATGDVVWPHGVPRVDAAVVERASFVANVLFHLAARVLQEAEPLVHSVKACLSKAPVPRVPVDCLEHHEDGCLRDRANLGRAALIAHLEGLPLLSDRGLAFWTVALHRGLTARQVAYSVQLRGGTADIPPPRQAARR
eukprot:scaffold45614_cov69-Phaeocystis_antarctica.AAC.3